MGSKKVGYVEALRRKTGHHDVRRLRRVRWCRAVVAAAAADAVGPWGLPGGAMELGETIEAAAVRETFEETGLRVQPDALLGVYTGDAHTYANGDVVQSVVVVLTATPVEGRLTEDSTTSGTASERPGPEAGAAGRRRDRGPVV